MKPLVLGLGNDILADDAAGVLAVRAIREQWGDCVDAVECAVSGIALLDYLMDYKQAIILDAIRTGQHPPGTVLELDPAALGPVLAPSPHYAGLPEILVLAKELELTIPEEIKIFAMEVADPYTVGGEMSGAVRQAIPALVDRVERQLREWKAGGTHA
ncbi:MAG TPA: hydrogenase maturation protease [bacterium]|nr:hydrogenase maturation protease [Candidatus Omnitrophota bacterium]HOJ59502.1 hydrogenase maturation protease [bacterium]HOL93459.1 hydrogenase maturation protease [bacterium]HPP00421.1 hydrogenase maturation protease [bacterium]HXK93090.1 hydrogenase maturation protease [bacterium]